jgi:hypothetical protein
MADGPAGVVRLKPGVEWRDLEGQVVALDLGTSDYLKLNESGTVLWTLVAAGATEAQLTDALVARFDIEPVRAHADAVSFVGRLRDLALVEEPA